MNKRIKKKVQKKENQKVFANIPKGHGLIIGNKWEGDDPFHGFEIGSIVKVDKADDRLVYCILIGEYGDNLHQTVFKEHILINN